VIRARRASGAREDDILQCFIDSRYEKARRPSWLGQLRGMARSCSGSRWGQAAWLGMRWQPGRAWDRGLWCRFFSDG